MLVVTVIYPTIPCVAEIFMVHQYPAILLGTHTLTFGTTNGLPHLLKHCISSVLLYYGKHAHTSHPGS